MVPFANIRELIVRSNTLERKMTNFSGNISVLIRNIPFTNYLYRDRKTPSLKTEFVSS